MCGCWFRGILHLAESAHQLPYVSMRYFFPGGLALLRSLYSALLLSLLLSACGLKGPLYLPDDPPLQSKPTQPPGMEKRR